MAKKQIKKIDTKDFTKIDGYVLCNNDKLERVINGVIGKVGQLEGGLGKDADPSLILAAYDKAGGLILDEDNNKIATGSFWDFINKVPRKDVKKAPEPNTSGLQIKEEIVGDESRPRKDRRRKVDEE